jgi:hypothetical protein
LAVHEEGGVQARSWSARHTLPLIASQIAACRLPFRFFQFAISFFQFAISFFQFSISFFPFSISFLPFSISATANVQSAEVQLRLLWSAPSSQQVSRALLG